ncbi:MAG: glycoside hydrolase family 38 C-terminal domain-containing protein [Anaerolineales bacterium]|jgi:alpha-mannosidase
MRECIVVPHTHWDREWYLPHEQYRYRLVALIDQLLEMLEKDPDYRHFLLDGQMVIAEDYLQIRPEMRARLQAHVEAGRIGIGPWYTMPDEFLVSGEALVRNLMLGQRMGQELGGAMQIGYVPDMFGHISQLPQILKGFGIQSAFLTRGIDWPQSELLWEAPDGSQLLTHWFSLGYGNARRLPMDPEQFRYLGFMDLHTMIDYLAGLATTDAILLMNGEDHRRPQLDLLHALRSLNDKLECRLVHGSLADYAAKVRQANPELQVHRGEMRTSRFSPILPGVLSSRVYLKQQNQRLQNLLEAYAEPIAGFALALGERYPHGFLWQAWKLLLQNHFHDSICASSVDQVHREMVPRFDRADQIAGEVVQDYLARLGRCIACEPDSVSIMAFNPTSQERSGLCQAWIDPNELAQSAEGANGQVEAPDIAECTLLNPEDRPVSFRVGERRAFPVDVLDGVTIVEKVCLWFQAEGLPPHGYKLYRLQSGGDPAQEAGSLLKGNRQLENAFFLVTVQEDGSLEVVDKVNGVIYPGLGIFEDSGDSGDSYNYNAPERQTIVTTRGIPADITVLEDQPGWATLRIAQFLDLPRALTPSRKGRSKKRVRCQIITEVTLQRGVRRIDFRTKVDNRASDHRLRVAFASGLSPAFSLADTPFDVVQRAVELPDGAGWVEAPSPTHPCSSFVAVEGVDRGLAVLGKGLHEYEVTPKGEILLTLLRSFGWLSRRDLKTRPGHAGPPLETPEGQCLGEHVFEYAVVPYQASWLEAGIHHVAQAFQRPPLAQPITGGGNLGAVHSFLQIDPAEFMITAIKGAEQDRALVVRLVNIANQPAEGRLQIGFDVAKVAETDLMEQHHEAHGLRNSVVQFEARAHEIKTLKFYLE